jgi:hypothetical protein
MMGGEVQVPETGVFWLSFVDPTRPKGDRFLGVAIVRAFDATDAVSTAWALGCNPGGEVLINGPMPEGMYLPEDMCRLLNADDARRLAVAEPPPG